MGDVVQNRPRLYMLTLGLNEMVIYTVKQQRQRLEVHQHRHQVVDFEHGPPTRTKLTFTFYSDNSSVLRLVNTLSLVYPYLLLARINTQKQPDKKKRSAIVKYRAGSGISPALRKLSLLISAICIYGKNVPSAWHTATRESARPCF